MEQLRRVQQPPIQRNEWTVSRSAGIVLNNLAVVAVPVGQGMAADAATVARDVPTVANQRANFGG